MFRGFDLQEGRKAQELTSGQAGVLEQFDAVIFPGGSGSREAEATTAGGQTIR